MSTLVAGYQAKAQARTPARPIARASHAHDIPASEVVSGAMHPAPLYLTALAYAVMIGTFWLGFVSDRGIGLAMAINTVTLAAFLGLPWALARQGKVTKAEHSLREFLNGYYDTGSGPISGWGAAILVTTVPLCLTAGVIAMAIIFNVLR